MQNGDDAARIMHRTVAGDFHYFWAVDGHGNVVLGDVVRREFRGAVVEGIRCRSRGEKSRKVGAVGGGDVAQGL